MAVAAASGPRRRWSPRNRPTHPSHPSDEDSPVRGLQAPIPAPSARAEAEGEIMNTCAAHDDAKGHGQIRRSGVETSCADAGTAASPTVSAEVAPLVVRLTARFRRPHLRDSWPDEGGAERMVTVRIDVRHSPTTTNRKRRSHVRNHCGCGGSRHRGGRRGDSSRPGDDQPLIYHHSRRVFLFGQIPYRLGVTPDPELLYLAAMFHDTGLVTPFSPIRNSVSRSMGPTTGASSCLSAVSPPRPPKPCGRLSRCTRHRECRTNRPESPASISAC